MKAFVSFLRGFASVILCIALFACTLAAIAIADVGTVVSKNGMQTIITQMLTTPSASVSTGTEEAPSSPLVEWAYDALADQYQSQLPIQQTELQGLVDNSGLKDFVAEKTASFVNDLYTGENTTVITKEEIVEQITQNKEIILEYFPSLNLSSDAEIEKLAQKILEHEVMQQLLEDGAAAFLGLSEEDVAALSGAQLQHHIGIRTNGSHAVLTAPFRAPVPTATATGSSSLGPVIKTLQLVRTYTSPTALAAVIGICAALLGLLFLCAWNKPHKAMIGGGISLLLAGSVFLIPTLLSDLMVALLAGIPLVGTLAKSVFQLTAWICTGVTIFGAVLIIGGIVLAILMNRPKTAKNTTEAEAV